MVSTSTYEVGTHSLIILRNYLLTHSIMSHLDGVNFYSRGWYLLTYLPTYLLQLEGVYFYLEYEADTYSLNILPTYLPTHFVMSHPDGVYFYSRGWYSLTSRPT